MEQAMNNFEAKQNTRIVNLIGLATVSYKRSSCLCEPLDQTKKTLGLRFRVLYF